MDSAFRLCFKEADRTGVISLWDLHKRYLLSPAQLSDFISKSLESGFITLDKSEGQFIVQLTKAGISWANSTGFNELFSENNLSWKEIPEIFKREKISVDGGYQPTAIDLIEFFGN